MRDDAMSGGTANGVLIGLAHPLCRSTIRYFERDAVATTATRVEVVNYVEQDMGDSAVAIAFELRHIHLPRLDELGWLEYNYQTGEIRHVGHDDAIVTLRQMLPLLKG
jgi:hypothetical protein